MRHAALLEAHRRLGLTIVPGLFDVLTEDEAEAIISLSEAGRRHARTDLDRLDAAIRTLIDVRYDDDITRGRARKALASMLDVKDALGDPADPDDPGELSDDPEDEQKAIADSKKADKAAKAADQKAAGSNPAGGDNAGRKATGSSPDSAAAGSRTINLKIAASADGEDDLDDDDEDDLPPADISLDDDEDDYDSDEDETISEAGGVPKYVFGRLNPAWKPSGKKGQERASQVQARLAKAKKLPPGSAERKAAMKEVREKETDRETQARRLARKDRIKAALERGETTDEQGRSLADRLKNTRGQLKAGRKKIKGPAIRRGAPKRQAIAASDDTISLSTVIAEGEQSSSGSTWDVLLIAPGVSKNRRNYRREVLQEAVAKGAFNGARSYAPDGPDHFGFGAYGRRRGTKELVGWWSNIRYDESVTLPDGGMAEGVVGTFHVSKAAPWLQTMLSDAWGRGKRDLIGWSIVGDGPQKVVRGNDGRPLIDVQSIGVVESIDPVTNPAAGGRTLRLVASKEGAVNWQGLTLAEAIKGLAAGSILPDELKENRPDLFTLVENYEGPAIPANDGVEAAVQPLVEAALGRFRVGQMLEAKLGLRRGLAEPLKARIRETIERLSADKVLSESELDEAIKAEIEYAAAFAPAGGPALSGGVEITDVKDEKDRMAEAVYAGLLGTDKGGEDGSIKGDPNFSIAKFYVDATGDSGFTGKYARGGRLTEGILAESIVSTTFDQVMGDAITRRMLDMYRLPGRDSWRQVVNTTSVKDFRTYRRIRMGGYGNLPTVAQGAPYNALTTPTDEEATYAVSKKGGTEDLTLEAIANDDLNTLRDIPRRLARAAANTLFEFVWDFVKDNPTIYDGVALYHATHGGNLGSTALGAASLAAGRLVLAKQAEMNSAKRIGIRPKFLAVPVDLEQTAYELTQTDREVGNNNNTLNFVRTMNLGVIPVDYWTDANNWFLIADPNEVPTTEIAFLNGREEPELFVQDSPTVGNVFTNDKITYKIRHIYGGAVMDYRGYFGAIVA